MEKNDKMADMESVISEIHEVLEEAWTLPLTGSKCIVDRDVILSLLDEMESYMPDEIVEAKKIIEAKEALVAKVRDEAENILTTSKMDAEDRINKAKVEAEIIVARAKEKADFLVSESSVYQETQAQCDEMLRTATNKVAELHGTSSKYVDDALRKTEETIAESLKSVKDARAQLNSLNRAPKQPSSLTSSINIDL